MQCQQVAFADESFHVATNGGVYVLACCVLNTVELDAVREAMLELRGRRRTSKLHWNEMDGNDRETAVKAIARLSAFHIVVVGSPVPHKRQERARVACLKRLVPELHSMQVKRLQIESRTAALDQRDVATIIGARFGLPKGAALRVDHLGGETEPLLWAADIVAGAVRSDHTGASSYRTTLDESVYEIGVDTDC